ncbi:MAG: hypothetical protein FWC46_02385, partial [Actinomycetia bacterium]|nr:hypothetical protein [Actinomycetes bacterium]
MRGRFTLVIAVVACGIAVAGCAPPAPSPTASSTSSVVSTTPVPSSTATTTPVRTNTNGLPVLPRIQVNRVPADGTVSEELLAGVQRFADDLADGNLDGVVAQCWAQASSDLRARWSDETTRRNALAWLSQPPRGVVGDWVWGATTGEATPDEYVAFGSLQPAGYACPTPLAFTPAQAALIVQRMVDTHNGTPYDGQGTVIDPGGRRCVYQPMTYGDWTEQIAGDVMSKAPGAIGV